MASESRVIRHRPRSDWEGVQIAPYKRTTDAWREVTRRTLIGEGGESAPFHLRYFEIGPGGHTTAERHRHEHVVVVLRGEGQVVIGDRIHDLRFGDVVYVAPNDTHQFRNAREEPFGFLCIVSAERDRPLPAELPGSCRICE